MEVSCLCNRGERKSGEDRREKARIGTAYASSVSLQQPRVLAAWFCSRGIRMLLDKINYSIRKVRRGRGIDLEEEKPAIINSTARTDPPSLMNLFRNNGTPR